MTATDFDIDFAEQQIALRDTMTRDDIYARACQQARRTGFAQLILEKGPADYRLLDGASPGALRLRRLHGSKVHVILDWS